MRRRKAAEVGGSQQQGERAGETRSVSRLYTSQLEPALTQVKTESVLLERVSPM